MTLRYVILHHTGIENPHYDLMYESSPGSALTTWRLPTWPITQPTPIERLPDHRRDYLTYQGPISNHRGQVAQIQSGSCQIQQLSSNQILVQFDHPQLRLLILTSPTATIQPSP